MIRSVNGLVSRDTIAFFGSIALAFIAAILIRIFKKVDSTRRSGINMRQTELTVKLASILIASQLSWRVVVVSFITLLLQGLSQVGIDDHTFRLHRSGDIPTFLRRTDSYIPPHKSHILAQLFHLFLKLL